MKIWVVIEHYYDKSYKASDTLAFPMFSTFSKAVQFVHKIIKEQNEYTNDNEWILEDSFSNDESKHIGLNFEWLVYNDDVAIRIEQREVDKDNDN